MKVLQLCNKPPFPSIDGGCMAMVTNLVGLSELGAELRVVTASTTKHPWKPNDWPQEILPKAKHAFLDTEVRFWPAIVNLFRTGSYNIDRFYSSELENMLIEELKAFNPQVVLIESLFMTPYLDAIRKKSAAKIVLRAHNVEHLLWQRLAENETNPIKKTYLYFLANRLFRHEVDAVGKVDAIAAITPEDARFFSSNSKAEVEIFPAGVQVPTSPARSGNEHLRFFHLGDMNWEPNKEAVNFFLQDIWPNLKDRLASSKVIFAGRNMPENLIQDSSYLTIMGDVESVSDFMTSGDVMLLPLKSGGGMRVKLIEAMSLGKCVISTSLGAEGLEAEDGVHLLIADSAEDFAAKMAACSLGQINIEEIGTNAQQLIKEKYDRTSISQRLFYFCQRLVRS